MVADKLDEWGGASIFASSILGGKDKLREAFSDIPDETLLWVNTDKVAAASGPIKLSETGEVVFRLYFDTPDMREKAVWIKGDDYKRFILAWAGELKELNVGEYEVPDGYRAISREDGKKVIVEKREKT